MNTNLMVVGDVDSLVPIKMTSKEIADFLGKKHSNVVRDIKIMMVELVGDDEFIKHRITGGLTKHEYIKRNINDLYIELMTSEDESYRIHVLLQGFIEKKDNRGYTSELILSKRAITTFAARNDTKQAFNLATYVDYLEEDARKKHLEAIAKRVETYRVPNFEELPSTDRKTLIRQIKVNELHPKELSILTKMFMNNPDFWQIVANLMKNGTVSTSPIDKMKELPNNLIGHEEKEETVKDFTKTENYLELLNDRHWSVREISEMVDMTDLQLWKTLYENEFIKNGSAVTYPNYREKNLSVHQEPYAVYGENYRKFFFIIKDYFGNRQLRITPKGKNYLIKRFGIKKLF